MPQPRSAGILVYRTTADGSLEVLLAHPGGPFFRRKDEGVWTIPKGIIEADETALEAAVREFGEETGAELPPHATGAGGGYVDLGEITQRGGKRVTAWAVEADLDPAAFESNTFEMEWPPRSGRVQRYPEIDRAEWFDLESARRKINPRQAAFIDRLEVALR
jgi:predicted NUDIX family NTP pyrophosphohydrolase